MKDIKLGEQKLDVVASREEGDRLRAFTRKQFDNLSKKKLRLAITLYQL